MNRTISILYTIAHPLARPPGHPPQGGCHAHLAR